MCLCSLRTFPENIQRSVTFNNAVPQASRTSEITIVKTANDTPQVRQEVWANIQRMSSPAILIHDRADADALTSALVMADVLKSQGKQPQIIMTEARNDTKDMLIQSFPSWAKYFTQAATDYDGLIVLDSYGPKALTKPSVEVYERTLAKGLPVVEIDHHFDEKISEKVVGLYSNTTRSTAGLLVHLFLDRDVPLSEIQKQALTYGIVSDTNGFRNPGTAAVRQFVQQQLLPQIAQQQHVQRLEQQLFNVEPYLKDIQQLVASAQVDRVTIGGKDYVMSSVMINKDYGSAMTNVRKYLANILGDDGTELVNILYYDGAKRALRTSLSAYNVDPEELDGLGLKAIAKNISLGGGHPGAVNATLTGQFEGGPEFLQNLLKALRMQQSWSIPQLQERFKDNFNMKLINMFFNKVGDNYCLKSMSFSEINVLLASVYGATASEDVQRQLKDALEDLYPSVLPFSGTFKAELEKYLQEQRQQRITDTMGGLKKSMVNFILSFFR